jgi:hypothetical protein
MLSPSSTLISVGSAVSLTLAEREASTLALAASKGYLVASDERRAFLREARARLGTGRIVDTPGIIVLAIRAGTLSVALADQLKAALETHRFSMRFSSFAELVGKK